MVDHAPLWQWIREREAIRVRKDDGSPPPWTTDPILAAYRFCCVRREDDRGTLWIRRNIREPFADHPNLWLMLCIARQINWPDTLRELIREDAWPSSEEALDPVRIAAVLIRITAVLNDRRRRGEKIYTGAYMISAPATKGADKQAYVAETVVGELWRRAQATGGSPTWTQGSRDRRSLREAHAWICQSNGWGPFMAYQAVVDMRFTEILRDAPDRLDWAAAGPGTIRGLNRLHGRQVDATLSQGQALQEMQAIYEIAEVETGVAMDFSDVPNALCETDKYLRVNLGQGKPRARYVPGRGS